MRRRSLPLINLLKLSSERLACPWSQGFPHPSAWSDAYGDYCNGERGRPLLVSLLLYLDAAWPRDWAAETLFLDGASDCGVAVRPRRCRAVLMDQVCVPPWGSALDYDRLYKCAVALQCGGC